MPVSLHQWSISWSRDSSATSSRLYYVSNETSNSTNTTQLVVWTDFHLLYVYLRSNHSWHSHYSSSHSQFCDLRYVFLLSLFSESYSHSIFCSCTCRALMWTASFRYNCRKTEAVAHRVGWRRVVRGLCQSSWQCKSSRLTVTSSNDLTVPHGVRKLTVNYVTLARRHMTPVILLLMTYVTSVLFTCLSAVSVHCRYVTSVRHVGWWRHPAGDRLFTLATDRLIK